MKFAGLLCRNGEVGSWLRCLVLVVVVIGGLVAGAETVFAGHVGECPLVFNRCKRHGYYTDVQFSTGTYGEMVMSTGSSFGDNGLPANNVDEFVNIINTRLNGTNFQDILGSSLIINTMLGRDGTDFANQSDGINSAKVQFADWENRVRYYDSGGYINFSLSKTFGGGTINSLYYETPGDPTATDDIFYRIDPADAETKNAIVFYNDDGSGSELYIIKKNCGNPIGVLGALNAPPGGSPPVIPGPLPPGCPSIGSSLQTVSLAPQGVPGPAGPPPTFGPAGATYYTYAPSGNYRITGVVDQWGQTAPYSPTGRNPNPFVIDYGPYITDYPYDIHNPIISYTTYYNRSDYRFTGADELDGAGNPTGNKQVVYVGQGITDGETGVGTQAAPVLNPCYKRGFDLTPSFTGTPNFDDTENPTNITFGARIEAQFSFTDVTPPPGQVREAFKVKFNTTVSYKVYRADGTIVPYPLPRSSTSVSGGGDCPFSGFNNGAPTAMSIGGVTKTPTTIGCDYTETYQAKIPPLQVGDKVCIEFVRVAPAAGKMDVAGNTSEITVASRDATNEPVPFCSVPLVNKPYLKVYGGDVMAGGAFVGGNCAQTSKIGAWYRLSSLAGSSAQFAALAMGSIDQFASAQLRTSAPTPVAGLAFANTGGTYGGSFGGSRCIADFYASQPSGATSFGGGDISTLNGAYSSGNITISGGTVTGKTVIFSSGDVTITGPITYTAGPWASLDAIPSLYIVARNIYIDKAVTQMDGTFVAQPSNPGTPGTQGFIYTCTDGSANIPGASLFNSCQTPLTINGSFVAQQVKFLRAFSSLRHSNRAEYPTNPSGDCLANPRGPTTYVCSAETFNFSPETYLAEPALKPTRSGSSGKYDFVTSLPPVL